MKTLLAFVISISTLGINAQSISFNYQFNLFYPQGNFVIPVHPIHDTLTQRDEFTPFLQTIFLGYDYELKPYLRIRPTVLFEWRTATTDIASGLKYYELNDSMVVKKFEALQGSNIYNFGIGINAVFDAFFKNPDEALNLVIGVNFKHFRKNESYIERLTEQNEIYEEIDILYKGLTANFRIGVEREVFFTKHFGFSLAVNWDIPYTFSPSTLEVRSLVENFETKEPISFKYDKSITEPDFESHTLPQESLKIRSFSVIAALKYRF